MASTVNIYAEYCNVNKTSSQMIETLPHAKLFLVFLEHPIVTLCCYQIELLVLSSLIYCWHSRYVHFMLINLLSSLMQTDS